MEVGGGGGVALDYNIIYCVKSDSAIPTGGDTIVTVHWNYLKTQADCCKKKVKLVSRVVRVVTH